MNVINEKKFVLPTVEIILFDTEDVIATSGNGNGASNWDIDLPIIDF